MTTTLIYLILGATWLFGLVVQRRLKATYARYAAVPNSSGLPGAAVARRILDANGLEIVAGARRGSHPHPSKALAPGPT